MQKSIIKSSCQEPSRYCCKFAVDNKINKTVYGSSGKSENTTVFNRFEEPPVPYGIHILFTVFIGLQRRSLFLVKCTDYVPSLPIMYPPFPLCALPSIMYPPFPLCTLPSIMYPPFPLCTFPSHYVPSLPIIYPPFPLCTFPSHYVPSLPIMCPPFPLISDSFNIMPLGALCIANYFFPSKCFE